MKPDDHLRLDVGLIAAIQTVFKWDTLIPAERIQVQVEMGFVTLRGEVEWDHQRQMAESLVRPLTGVLGVINHITVQERKASSTIATRIREALTRHAEEEARQIEVLIAGSNVTLRGSVDSWADRTAAQEAAISTPGVANVDNQLRVMS